MHLYIWQYVDGVSSSYHSGGGLAVIAKSLEQARDFILDKLPGCGAQTIEPDACLELRQDHEPDLWVFPDAGCC